MYDSSDGAPTSGSPPGVPDSSRYVYLMSRLRSKQITMEEATELFAVQQAMIRQANRRAPPPTTTADAPGTRGSASPGVAGTVPPMSDDAFALALLAFGAGAGVLAAVLKRSQSPDPPRSAPR